jgi:hypothetical protein
MEQIRTDNLLVAQIVKKIIRLYWNQIVMAVYKTPPMNAILSQIIPVHSRSICFKIHMNIINLFTPCLSSSLFPSGFPVKILYTYNVPQEF